MADLFITPDDRLQAVFDQARPGTVIHMSPGVYRQKAVIRTPDLTLVGAGADKTRITYQDYARKRGDDGFELITFRSYTLAVCADGVTMRDLAVCNDAGDPQVKGQQIALSVVGGDFLMENCRLASTQDTLFAGPLPPDLIERYEGFLPDELRRGGKMQQLFRGCRIEGSLDFIFGCGNAVFEDCVIHSVFDGRPIGYVAAPAHSPEQAAGFCFHCCTLTAEAAVPAGSVYLARPWRDYGLSRFEDCVYGTHICEAGFDPWSGTRRDETARFYEKPAREGRVAWINRDGEGKNP